MNSEKKKENMDVMLKNGVYEEKRMGCMRRKGVERTFQNDSIHFQTPRNSQIQKDPPILRILQIANSLQGVGPLQQW